MTESGPDLPVLGAALNMTKLHVLLAWLRDGDRDVEIQDFGHPKILDGEWQGVAKLYRSSLDGHGGRIGIHGPFYGFDIGTTDSEIQVVVQRRFLQALEAAEAVGATQMVVHSPFNHWHHRNFGHQEGLKDQIFEASHSTLGPAVRRAEEIGCELVIENIQDVDPLDRVRLVESFGSAAVRVSFDTGHARMMSDMAGAPPIDYFVKCAGKLLHHVHLQDTDGYADRHWLPGDGDIEWHGFFETLRYSDNPRLIVEVTSGRMADIPNCAARFAEAGLAR